MLLYWLKLGTWPDWSVATLGLTPPTTVYLGFNKMLVWRHARELAVVSFGFGLLLVWMGLWLSEDFCRSEFPARGISARAGADLA